MEALLLIEVDGHPAVVAEEAEGVRRILQEVHADEVRLAADAAEAARLAAARRTALSAVARVSPTTIIEDATVPRSRLAETFAEIERLKEKYGVRVATYGHAGDGNLHPTAATDERNREEIAHVHAFFSDLYDKVLSLGGTVSGEHGIGTAKKDYLLRQLGAGGVAVMRRIKDSFDPAGRLNPGKIFLETLRPSPVRHEGGTHV
jgi:glycolate oxidase